MQVAQAPTVELPEKLYIVTHHHPMFEATVPLMVPFPPLGFGMPVFSEADLLDGFLASPNVDVPCKAKEITLEHLIRGGEYPINVAKEHNDRAEYFYIIDPGPIHTWDKVENMGYVIPMRVAAEALRAELDEE